MRWTKAAILQSKKKTSLSKAHSHLLAKQYLTSGKGKTDQIVINTDVTWKKIYHKEKKFFIDKTKERRNTLLCTLGMSKALPMVNH